MPWVILELASYLSKQKKYSFLSPLLVAAVVGPVRLWRNLSASGASPDQQPSKISAVVGRKNQCERVRLWRMEFECAKSYQYWPKEQVYESGGGGILFVPTESGRNLSASGVTCAPLVHRLTNNRNSYAVVGLVRLSAVVGRRTNNLIKFST